MTISGLLSLSLSLWPVLRHRILSRNIHKGVPEIYLTYLPSTSSDISFDINEDENEDDWASCGPKMDWSWPPYDIYLRVKRRS
ncbi:uncharacterized protein BO87DRAFT_379308 [Aspergillus neoniger CBS 115656]|uniref:Uncharacterized protein n=1 Tax=Aspergillus neoniger (strain CBS 115656) TaxID=1448310 RepID=A0A318Y9Z0_ASPNB|nr:hypothetical protein BO87DRAFT_379308 [Aspergillus neoniger CBS 115656]PYH31151.1 hypothetical protein BO87DRAFT_379308 [Aspergillus neoniger CBS 115656]